MPNFDARHRPGHFIQVKAAGTQSLIENLSIKNYPAHCFTLGGSNLVVRNIKIDNSDGYAPNDLSGGKAAAHKYVMILSVPVMIVSNIKSVVLMDSMSRPKT